MKAEIGFFQEQQPNGVIANSSTRILVWIPMIIAVIYSVSSINIYYTECMTLLAYLHQGIIKFDSFMAMRDKLTAIDWKIVCSLITISLGGKAYTKIQEIKATNSELTNK